MEAKDTVEGQKYSDFITCPSCGTHHVILYNHIREEQAEITWDKAVRELVGQIGDCFIELTRIVDVLKDSNKSNALAVDALLNINRKWQAQLEVWGIEKS